MNYREPLTKNEIREHAAHYENSNPAVYCGTYAKYNNGSLYGMWIDLSTFENYHDFMEFCNRLHANEAEPELMFQDYEATACTLTKPSRNSCSKITSITPNNGIVKAAWAKARSIKSKNMPPLARNAARLTRLI